MSERPTIQVNFRMSAEDRRLISAIAKRLERGEGDALRFIIRKAARELGIIETSEAQRTAEEWARS